MELISGPPSCWIVTLNSGAEIELWADMFSQSEGFYEFEVLVRADLAEQSQVRVVSGPDGSHDSVLITIARIPETEVANVESALVVDDQE
jgi:hypothetical protein